MYKGKIKVRGVIIDNGKLFLCKLACMGFYCLPGGTLETGESLKDCLEREMIEELGIKPKIGGLVYVNEFTSDKGEPGIDFWFNILNVKDFYKIDLSKTSHGFELTEVGFYDLENLDYRPAVIKELLEKWKINGLPEIALQE